MARKKNNSSRSKPRMSLTGILAFAIAPLATFIYGVPGISGGAFFTKDGRRTDGPLGIALRLTAGFNALSSAYFGYNFREGKFVPMALLQGYLPIVGAYVVRKTKINRLASRSVPLLM